MKFKIGDYVSIIDIHRDDLFYRKDFIRHIFRIINAEPILNAHWSGYYEAYLKDISYKGGYAGNGLYVFYGIKMKAIPNDEVMVELL